MRVPWCDAKVAFSINDAEKFWRCVQSGMLSLPAGWEANETDGVGASGYVAIFRVSGEIRVEDGQAVVKELRRLRLKGR